MSTGNSSLFSGTAGARAEELDAPIGFDKTPPESAVGVHALSCRDILPRAICPPLTNGGAIRTMDNRQLAQLAVRIASVGPLTEDEYFKWLGEPSAACMAHDRECGKEFRNVHS